MYTVEIKKGKLESSVECLGNSQIAAIYCPSSPEQIVITILGSADGNEFMPIYQFMNFDIPFAFTIWKDRKVIVFNAPDFEGIQYYKFIASVAPEHDLQFPVYYHGF
jgi:hypothetical protein